MKHQYPKGYKPYLKLTLSEEIDGIKPLYPIRTCDNCFRDYRARTYDCPYCGHNSRHGSEWVERVKRKGARGKK